MLHKQLKWGGGDEQSRHTKNCKKPESISEEMCKYSTCPSTGGFRNVHVPLQRSSTEPGGGHPLRLRVQLLDEFAHFKESLVWCNVHDSGVKNMAKVLLHLPSLLDDLLELLRLCGTQKVKSEVQDFISCHLHEPDRETISYLGCFSLTSQQGAQSFLRRRRNENDEGLEVGGPQELQ